MPLAFCGPSIDLARLYVRYGADSRHLSFIQLFMDYAHRQPDLNPLQDSEEQMYLKFLVKELSLNPNDRDAEGKDAVFHSCQGLRLNLLKFLAEDLGASIEIPNFPTGRTALLDAALKGHVDLFTYLLS